MSLPQKEKRIREKVYSPLRGNREITKGEGNPIKGFYFEPSKTHLLDVQALWLGGRTVKFVVRRLLFEMGSPPIFNGHITTYFRDIRSGEPITYGLDVNYIGHEITEIVKDIPFQIEPLRFPENNFGEVTNERIPNIVFVTNKDNRLDYTGGETWNLLLEKTRGYEVRFYNDEDCKRFLENEYGPLALEAFNNVKAGAFKADLWRYAALYKYGGIYIDMDIWLLAHLQNIVFDDDELVVVKDRKGSDIYQAFFATRPGNPIIAKCLEKSISNIMNEYYGTSPLAITGPRMMGYQVKLSVPPVNKKDPTKNKKIRYFKLVHGICRDDSDIPLFVHKIIDETSDYGKRWRERKIFNSNSSK